MTSPDSTPPQPPAEPPPAEPPPAEPPPAEPAGPRRLTRSSTDQVLGGVAGGLGRYFDVDPILFRIGFAVAALAGGAGLLAYFALWFLVPDEHGDGARRPDGRTLAVVATGGVLLCLLVGVLGVGGDLSAWPGLFSLLLLGVLVAAVFSADRGGDTRSRLLRAMLVVLGVLAAGALGLFAAVGTAFGGGAIVAGVVILLGLGLVAGAFGHGRRWLLIPALVLATPAAIVQAADLRIEGGVGEREYRPASVSDLRDAYELGAGEMVIDLRDVEFPAGRTEMEVDLGLGAVEIVVPDDVCVATDAEIGAGVATIFDRENGDIDLDWAQRPADGVSPDLVIEADIDFGALYIRYPSDPEWDDDHGDDGPFDHGDHDGFGPVYQRACPA